MAILNPLGAPNAAIRIDSSNKVVATATGGMSLVSTGGADVVFQGGGIAYLIGQGPAYVRSIVDDVLLEGRDIKVFATAGILLSATTNLTISAPTSIKVNQFTTTGAVVSSSTGILTDANASTAGFVLTSNGSGSAPSFQAAAGGGMTWTTVTGTSATMAGGNGYIANNGSLVSLTLPASSAVGDMISIVGSGAGGWRIIQLASQQVRVGSTATTVGVTGTTSSANRYDSLTLVCTTANTIWMSVGAPLSAGLDLL